MGLRARVLHAAMVVYMGFADRTQSKPSAMETSQSRCQVLVAHSDTRKVEMEVGTEMALSEE